MDADIEKRMLEVLTKEFAGSLYDGVSADAAITFFNEGRDVDSEIERPIPLSVAEVLKAISRESAAKLVMLPSLTDIRDKIQANDIEGVLLWCQLLAMAGVINSDEESAIQKACVATETTKLTTREDARVISVFVGHAEFPNQVDRETFDSAWKQAGRK